MLKILMAALLVLAVGPSEVTAQDDLVDTEGSLYRIPPRQLIDMPSAGVLPRGHFDLGLRLYPDGGSISSTNIGLSNRLTLGISWGGEKIISNESPHWNKRIEFNVKFRILDELEVFPAVTVGFSSQGYGPWNNDFNRYEFKSRGFYAVASRSFYFLDWTAGWHGGINYSRENDVDHDKDINLFGGVDVTFRYDMALLFEYDAALNDNKSTLPDGRPYLEAGKGRGYLNMSIKWLFSENLELEALLKDLLTNRRNETFTREIRITYLDSFR